MSVLNTDTISSFTHISSFFLLDVEECVLNITECPSNSICINTLGSYICECSNGFTKHGNECLKGIRIFSSKISLHLMYVRMSFFSSLRS